MPSGSLYGKLIKYCFVAKAGWIFWGIDANALEERIGTILSGDPNRIKIYTRGFDGHSIRAHRYFKNEMPDIEYQLSFLDQPGKFYEVILEDGIVEYIHESQLGEYK